MSINGSVKFFEPSQSLFKDGATATANSNSSNAVLILNYDKETAWVSDGSSEGSAATITIDLGENKTFNRLFLINHNFKTFTVTYGSGATDFANVVTINNGSQSTISESSFAYDTAYYEFDEVTTDQINISCTYVQAPATTEEKFLASLIICEEIGQFTIDGIGRPNARIDANNRIAENIHNKSVVQRGIDVFACSISSQYTFDQEDLDLFLELFDRNEDFLIWLCGGRVGTPYFRLNHKPYRLRDLYRVRNVQSLSNNYYKGLKHTGTTNELNVIEVEG